MRLSKVQAAAREARRFLDRVAILEDMATENSARYDFVHPGKDSAAVRRASMDLTRALAEMRKS